MRMNVTSKKKKQNIVMATFLLLLKIYLQRIK